VRDGDGARRFKAGWPDGNCARTGRSDHRWSGRRDGGPGAGPEGAGTTMIPVPSGVRVWIAAGATDMRRGMNGLALQIQETLKRDPHAGDIFAFRGRRGDLLKLLLHAAAGVS